MDSNVATSRRREVLAAGRLRLAGTGEVISEVKVLGVDTEALGFHGEEGLAGSVHLPAGTPICREVVSAGDGWVSFTAWVESVERWVFLRAAGPLITTLVTIATASSRSRGEEGVC